MKWIKLFEGFDQNTKKIKWLNDIFFYFKIIMNLNHLQMIETKSNIYFYEELDNERVLKFVYCKKNPEKDFRETLLCSFRARFKYIVENIPSHTFDLYSLRGSSEIYEKAIKDFFSEYLDTTSLIKYPHWNKYENRFNKLVINSK